jgi:hypothetical protein
MNVLYTTEQYKLINFARIGLKFIQKTKTRPVRNLLQVIQINLIHAGSGSGWYGLQNSSQDFVVTWIETFSELPPDDFMNILYNHDKSVDTLSKGVIMTIIGSKFITVTKTKPDDVLLSRIQNDMTKPRTSSTLFMNHFLENRLKSQTYSHEFIINWIETFSELPPYQLMNTFYNSKYCEYSDFPEIGTCLIRKTKTMPGAELMSQIISYLTVKHSVIFSVPDSSQDFIITWLKTFSELPPDDFMKIIYARRKYVNFAFEFVQITKTKPDSRLIMHVISNATRNILTEFYELWIKTFSELPPTEILDNVTRNSALETQIISDQKLNKIGKIANRIYLNTSDDKLLDNLRADLYEIKQILNSEHI